MPLARNGRESLDNLVYACDERNRAKGDYFGNTDDTRLLHPLTDDLTAHIAPGDNGLLCPLSPLGETFIAVLN